MTKAAARALVILKEHGPQRAREFAKLMWPDSPGWDRWASCSRHTIKGAHMWLKGGQYLSHLYQKGWVRQYWRDRNDPFKHANAYYITDAGNVALREHLRGLRT